MDNRVWVDTKAGISEALEGLTPQNLKDRCCDLFQNNLIVGKVYFAQQVLAQASKSPARELAALLAVVNSELNDIGEFVLQYLVRQFLISAKQEPETALNTAVFVADLYNHGMAQIELVAEMVLVLQYLGSNSAKVVGRIATQSDVRDYLVEKVGQVDFEPFDLDIVLDKYKLCHDLDLKIKDLEPLPEREYEWPNADRWDELQAVILGLSSQKAEPESISSPPAEVQVDQKPQAMGIVDMTQSEDTGFKKQVYLVVMSALSAEEATHKVLRIKGPTRAIVKTIVEIAGQEKTINPIYSNIGYRLCRLVDDEWRHSFESEFSDQWESVQQYETNQIRNIGRLFGYLLASDSLDWQCLECVDLTISGSTPSTRIFLQSVFNELRSEMGSAALVSRLEDPDLKSIGIFPVDSDDKKFARDFFKAINMGPVADLVRSRINAGKS